MDKEKRGLLTDYDDGATPRRHNKTSSTPGSLNVLGKKKFAYNTKTTTEREQLYRYSRAVSVRMLLIDLKTIIEINQIINSNLFL